MKQRHPAHAWLAIALCAVLTACPGEIDPLCGNGAVEAGEACDDGNSVDSDTCTSTCQVNTAVCGNGTLETGEACDDGNRVDTDACSNACTVVTVNPVCGNSVRETGEACDDGNTVDTDACTNACTVNANPAVCGNNVRENDEQCDDGNQVDDDWCSNLCVLKPGCGNGVREAEESCDDGNNVDGDWCTATCTTPAEPVCGNGTVEVGEQCDDNNTESGDACESNCSLPPAAVTCPGASIPPPATGSCTVTAGSGKSVLVTGVILGETTTYVGGQVLYDQAGVLQCVGCDCAGSAGADTATQLVCPEVVVSPGLINAHDHLTYQQPPYTGGTDERYEHRHDWRIGNNGHTTIPSSGNASNDAKAWAELRQIMAGTTSLNGSGSVPGFMRNLDWASNTEGLGLPVVEYETFPLGSSLELMASCNYGDIVEPGEVPATGAYTPHVAEGIEESARNELRCLFGQPNAAARALMSRTAVIHSVAASATEAAWLAQGGTSVVWSPRTNVSLYGDTAPIPLYRRMGVNTAMGTDWLISGSMNMLRELQCADSLNQNYWARSLTDAELWRMATVNGAEALKVGEKLGRLEQGKLADLALFRLKGFASNPHRAVLTAGPDDVVLTVRGGKALFGDADVVQALGAGCETLDVCSTAKAVCLAGEGTKTFAELRTSQASAYPLFTCGAPADEPTCTPARTSTNASWPASTFGSSVYSGMPQAGDEDSDGVPDAEDNCVGLFNPIRPMDQGVQSDVDGDGKGDLCDPCPTGAEGACGPLDAADRDADGTPDATDVCPLIPDNQADSDGDGKGNACDLCPSANPGSTACVVTIPDFKQSVSHTYLLMGERVALTDVVVTGVTVASSGGFFIQMRQADPTTGFDFGGAFVFHPANSSGPGPVDLQPGHVIDLTASVSSFRGQVQLSNAEYTVVSTGAALPAPAIVTSTDVSTGGPRAAALEGVRVQVSDVVVESLVATGEFVATTEGESTGVRVDKFLFPGLPVPEVGENFASISGVLAHRNSHSNVEVVSAADLVAGPVRIGSFGEGTSYARVGATGASAVPQPLRVTLRRPAESEVTVQLEVFPTGILDVSPVLTIPVGSDSAEVLLSGLVEGTVTVTATLNGASKTATVQVIAADAPVTLIDLGASATTEATGETVTFTATLDLPAAVDTTVALVASPAPAVTIPATVTIPAGQLQATFDAVLNQLGSATVSATLGAVTLPVTLTIVEPSTGGLVINEVDYDQNQADTKEFVELFNAGNLPISLVGKELVFFNGSGTGGEYFVTGGARIDLSLAGAQLAPGQYLLFRTAAVTVPGGVLSIDFTPAAGGSIQNGAPDALGVWDTVTSAWVDRLSYEGDTKVGGVSMQEGAASTTTLADPGNDDVSSISRLPNGADTDVNGVDFKVSGKATPGAPNEP